MPSDITGIELADRYDALLIDAYGVLVHADGAMPRAAEFLEALDETGTPWLVVTNDASRTPDTASRAYGERGVRVPADRIVTAGSLLEDWFEEHGLHGKRSVVLGPPDSCTYVRGAGGRIVDWHEEPHVVVLADEAGFDFLPAFDAVLSHIVRRSRSGETTALVVPNPDVVYPRGDGAFGVASGGVAHMMETALQALLGEEAPTFDRLGKPNPALFQRAVSLLGGGSCVMLGDQLETDIRGANRSGIASALVTSGVSGRGASMTSETTPTWIVRDLL